MKIDDYQRKSKRTNFADNPDVFFHGLVGEVGSIFSAHKKIIRDNAGQKQVRAEVCEELGDIGRDLFDVKDDEAAQSELENLIEYVWSRYGRSTNEQLKTAVYMTSPMRVLLRAEKYGRTATFNHPVEFGL